MRLFVNIFAAFIALGASAFDSQAWLLKRDAIYSDAMKLKAVYEDCAAKVFEAAENISVPLESHKNGAIKSLVFAKKAQFFLESGLIWGEDVVVRELKNDGSEVARIDAKNCVVDRNSKSGWAQGHVKALYGKTMLEGDGVYMSFPREFIAVMDNAKIVSSEFEMGKAKPKDKSKGKPKSDDILTTLTSKRADYDRAEGVVMFEDGVYLDNSEYKFASDRLFVFLEGTNELKRVVALGNVSVTNGNNCGSCDRAMYVRKKGKVTMYALDENNPARLEDRSKKARNQVEGDKISFWLDSEQVEVENSRITVDAGGKLKL